MRDATALLKERKGRQPRLHSSTAGFTLVELLAAVIMVGVLAVAMAPGYLGWLNRTRINTARNTVVQAIREAQSNAQQNQLTWQASFRENNGSIEWATHAKNAASNWQAIDEPDIQVFKNTSYTTLAGGTQGPWSITFNAKGQVEKDATDEVNGYLGRITITSAKSSVKRCVIVSTLLGSFQTAGGDECDKTKK